MEVFLADGEIFQARYLVDATGFRSVLADKLELRDPVPRAATCSRTIFTHVEGLRPFDALLGENEQSGLGQGPGVYNILPTVRWGLDLRYSATPAGSLTRFTPGG